MNINIGFQIKTVQPATPIFMKQDLSSSLMSKETDLLGKTHYR
jgi:hypothetical protein